MRSTHGADKVPEGKIQWMVLNMTSGDGYRCLVASQNYRAIHCTLGRRIILVDARLHWMVSE